MAMRPLSRQRHIVRVPYLAFTQIAPLDELY